MGAKEQSDLDPAALIENTLILVRERAHRREVTLAFSADGRLGVIRADERKVKQVLLLNLSDQRAEIYASPRPTNEWPGWPRAWPRHVLRHVLDTSSTERRRARPAPATRDAGQTRASGVSRAGPLKMPVTPRGRRLSESARDQDRYRGGPVVPIGPFLRRPVPFRGPQVGSADRSSGSEVRRWHSRGPLTRRSAAPRGGGVRAGEDHAVAVDLVHGSFDPSGRTPAPDFHTVVAGAAQRGTDGVEGRVHRSSVRRGARPAHGPVSPPRRSPRCPRFVQV